MQMPLLFFSTELSVSAYSCDDLFHQRVLLDASLNALEQIVEVSRPVR